MKKLLFLFALLFCFSSRAQLVTGVLKITNAPVNGSAFVANGFTFYWTNGTPIGSQAILITNTLAGDGTNMLNVAGLILPFNGVSVTLTNGTNFIFLGNNMAMSITTNWASLVLTTNGNGAATNVTVPMSTLDVAARTNIASQLLSDLNANSTNAINQANAIASELVGLTNVQIISGAKNFTGGISGLVSNFTNGYWTNPATSGGSFTNPALVNGSNSGLPFRSPGGGFGSEQFGLSASASTNSATAFGNTAQAVGVSSTSVGGSSAAVSNFATAFGSGALANGAASTAIGRNADALLNNDTALGNGSSASGGFSTAIGNAAVATLPHQIVIGTASEYVQFPGSVFFTGNETNITATGTNTINAAIVQVQFENTNPVTGVNQDLAIGTNALVNITGPSGSFSIAGIASGLTGRIIELENSSGQTMTILNNSGSESTATNRITTGTGADVVITRAPGFARLKYDLATTHWQLEYP